MASSKSSRFSTLPSSFSLSTFRSSSPSSDDDAKHNHVDASGRRPKAKLRRDKSSLGRLAMLNQGHVVPIETLDEKKRPVERDLPPLPPLPSSSPSPPPPSQTVHSRKPRAWGNRVSTFLPSLITRDPESTRPGSAHGTPPPPESAPPLPPPYQYNDSNANANTTNEVSPVTPVTPTILARPPSACSNDDSTQHPVLTSSFSSRFSNPPPPPSGSPPPPPTQLQQSPKAKRATLTKNNDSGALPQRDSASTFASTAPSAVGSSKDDSPRNKLQKGSQVRASSGSRPSSPAIAAIDQGGRRPSGQMPLSPLEPRASNRISSMPLNAPKIVASPSESSSLSPARGRLRRSFMPGARSRSASGDISSSANKKAAWVVSDGSQAEYNPSFLKNGEKVPELWNESGNVLVYLYPRGSGCGPSFKVMEFTVNSSYIFNALIQGNENSPIDGGRTTSFSDRSLGDDIRSQTMSPTLSEGSDDMKLYLPIAPPSAEGGQLSTPGNTSDADLERLIAIRNMFAFLTGQPLVATQARPTTFHAFLEIASLLEEFGFTSEDGTTFGPAVDLSFDFYIEQLGLSDCRHSREKTVEALVLGERMRSIDLYSEAFAHAAGKYTAIMDLKLPLFNQVYAQTRQQLERAHLDLVNRQHNVNQNIEHFEFPALFAGTASSSSSEVKYVRFKMWKHSFSKMRSLVLSHYKSVFGSWPPKASSSKNPFAESGLNRLVLKSLYADMCAVYDLLVDRKNPTTRTIDEAPPISSNLANLSMSTLRRILSESDRSKPPVLPPMPYDTPLTPSMSSVQPKYATMTSREQIKFDKSVKEQDMIKILEKSYNEDTNRNVKNPFLAKFREFELREAKGKMAPDLVDQRIGYWLFIYVVLQSLPTLVIDAPGINFTEGTEYFLCEPPMGNPPWCADQHVKKMWYEVAGGGGLVELSTDVILFSIEATYHRSHCWLAAKKWDGGPDLELEDEQANQLPYNDSALGPLQPPPALQADDDFVGGSVPSRGTSPTLSPPPGSTGSPPVTLRPRNLSPGPGAGSRASRMSHAYRSSMAIGLEPVPMEPPVLPFGNSHNRSSSLGPRPMSGALGARTRSVGNLAALGGMPRSVSPGVPGRTESPTGANTGATFDDILGETDPVKKKKALQKERKKSFFFG